MPPIFAAFVTIFTTISTAIGALGPIFGAILRIGLAIGISALSKSTAPKPGIRGSTLQVSLNANDPRRVLFGRIATAGALVTFQSWGDNNEYIVLLFRVADHQCTGLVSVYWNGNLCTLGVGGAVSQFNADSNDNCWITFANGDWNQAADADMIANSGGRWTSNDRGRGVAYVKIKARANNTAWPGGLSNLFQFVFVIDGAAFYDRRLDSSVGGSGSQRFNDQSTWALTSNAGVVTENFMRGIRAEDTGTAVGSRTVDYFCGLKLPDSVLPFSSNVAAFNHCDEAVTLKAGGTEPRYRVGGVVTVDQTMETILSDLLATMAGKLLTAAGRYILLPGVVQTSVRTFSDTDIRLDGQLQYTQDIALDTVANTVTGQFLDPSALYSPQPLPPRTSSADQITDGGYKADTLDLSYVTSLAQGQRVQEIHRERARRQRAATIVVAPENMDLEAGDRITWVSARFGWTLDFEILQTQTKATDQEADLLEVVLSLQEVDDGVFAWTPAVDELSRTAPTGLPSAGPTTVVITAPTAVTGVIVGPSGTSIPVLQFTCQAFTDPTVTSLHCEYRVLGLPGSAPQTLTADFPIHPPTEVHLATDVFNITAGIVGGYQYQIRAYAVQSPPRTPSWSSWITTTSTTQLHVAGTFVGQAPAATDPTIQPGATTNQVFVSATDPALTQTVHDGALWTEPGVGEFKRVSGVWVQIAAYTTVAPGSQLVNTSVTGSTTVTLPAGSYGHVDVELWGPGGDGNYLVTGKSVAWFGGGAGEYRKVTGIAVTPGSTPITFNISNTVGTASTVSATGPFGAMSAHSGASATTSASGAGGTGGSGGTGTPGHAGGLTNAWDGGGAAPAFADQTTNGSAGTVPAGGGAGAYNPGSGIVLSPHAPGKIIVTARA